MENSLKAIEIRMLAQIRHDNTWKTKGYRFEFGKFKVGNNYKAFYYLDKFYKTKENFKMDLDISRRAFDRFFKECLDKNLIKWDKRN